MMMSPFNLEYLCFILGEKQRKSATSGFYCDSKFLFLINHQILLTAYFFPYIFATKLVVYLSSFDLMI